MNGSNGIHGFGKRPYVMTDHLDGPDSRLGVLMLAIEPEVVPLPVNRPNREYLIQVMAGMGFDWEVAGKLVRIGDGHRVIVNQMGDKKSKRDALALMPRCCGWAVVRDNGVMYAHHRKEDSCPVHGQVKAGAKRGLRKFVRKEDETAVQEAMERYKEWAKLEEELKRMEMDRRFIAERLDTFVEVGGA